MSIYLYNCAEASTKSVSHLKTTGLRVGTFSAQQLLILSLGIKYDLQPNK